MADQKDDTKKSSDFSFITQEGGIDWAKFPIGTALKDAVDRNDERFSSACITLGIMSREGRTEAEVFLFGMLTYYENDLARKSEIVEALKFSRSKRAAQVLFSELDQIVSSNTTRAYINTILETLGTLPKGHVKQGLEKLIQEKKWTYKMKAKFTAILEELEW